MTGTFVIVEGADGTGKTTLAEKIAAEYGVEYEHVGPPRDDMTPFAEHVEYAFVLTEEYGRVVFDRFHLGCFCYGPIWRPENDVDGIGDFRRADWDLLENLIRDRCFLVVADPGWTQIEETVTGRDDSTGYRSFELDLTRVEQAYRRFEKAYEFSTLNKTTFDYREAGAWERLTRELEEALGWTVPSTALTR